MSMKTTIDNYGLREYKKSECKISIIYAYLEEPDINIGDLMKKCNYSRATFFNYFSSIDAVQIACIKYHIINAFFEVGFYDEPLIQKLLTSDNFKALLPVWVKSLSNTELDYNFNQCDLCLLFEIEDTSSVTNILNRYYSKKFLAKLIYNL